MGDRVVVGSNPAGPSSRPFPVPREARISGRGITLFPPPSVVVIRILSKLENEIELLERHFSVLQVVLENGPVGIVSLSTQLGYPNHKIRYSLRRLEEEGLIEPSQRGPFPLSGHPSGW